MKKIAAVCGHGLGSSFIVEMNIKWALKELNVSSIEVEHLDLGSCYQGVADLIICGRDLEDNCKKFGEVLVLTNLLDKNELLKKLEAVLKSKEII